ncbi:MAG: hypothetical protein ACI4JB_04155, partial [Porcipelethomonas sp.]
VIYIDPAAGAAGQVLRKEKDGKKMELQGISKLDLKRRNRAQILRVIRECGPISRVDIASSMKITRAAVTIITNEMIEEGVLYEVGEAPVTPEKLQKGRRKILININENYKFALGASISDERITVGLSNINGNIMEKMGIELADNMNSDDIVEYIVSSCKKIIQNSGLETKMFLGLGVGILPDMCSRMKIYMKDGKLDYSPLIASLSAELSMPVTCANLTSALALANQDNDIKERIGNYVLLRQGRHLNLSVLIDNDVMSDNRYYTNHVENMIVNPGGRKVSGYPDGSVKAELTTVAIMEKLREIYSKEETPVLWEITNGNFNNISYKALSAAAAKGEAKALDAASNISRCLSILVNNLSTVFFAKSVILHGFGFDDWMFDYFKKYLITLCGEDVSKKIKISRVEGNLEFKGGICVVIYEQFYNKGGIDKD